jgi:hypothetical protein
VTYHHSTNEINIIQTFHHIGAFAFFCICSVSVLGALQSRFRNRKGTFQKRFINERIGTMTDHPMSKRMQDILETILDAKNGEISGWSIATWLLQRKNPTGVRESLRGLVNRGLITMRPMDEPNDDFRKAFPDRMKAMYSIVKPK